MSLRQLWKESFALQQQVLWTHALQRLHQLNLRVTWDRAFVLLLLDSASQARLLKKASGGRPRLKGKQMQSWSASELQLKAERLRNLRPVRRVLRTSWRLHLYFEWGDWWREERSENQTKKGAAKKLAKYFEQKVTERRATQVVWKNFRAASAAIQQYVLAMESRWKYQSLDGWCDCTFEDF